MDLVHLVVLEKKAFILPQALVTCGVQLDSPTSSAQHGRWV